MSPSDQFSRAVLPDIWEACGVRLMPLTLGHALLLGRLGSPVLPAERAEEVAPIGLGDVLVAAWVCSRPATVAIAGLDGRRQMLWLRWKRITRAAVISQDKLALLRYVAAAYQMPPVKALHPPEGEGRQSPWLAILLLTLVSYCGHTVEEALDTPLATAQWMHALRMEESGILAIESLEHQAMAAAAEEQRRMAIENPAAIQALIEQMTGKPSVAP